MVTQFGTLSLFAALLTIRSGPIPLAGVFAAIGVMSGGMAFTRVGNVVASYVHQFKRTEHFDMMLGAVCLEPLRRGQITLEDIAAVEAEARDNAALGSLLNPGQMMALERSAA